MYVRSILTGILPFLLGGVLVTACDKQDAAKTDEKKADAKADEKKADAKAADLKADVKADEAKADAKADDLKAAADAAGADETAEDGGAEGKADDMKADPDTKAEDTKADPDTKAEDTKADPATKTDKKPDTKTDKKPDDTKAEPASKVDGKKLYADKCASCHGASGKADTKLAEKNKVESWATPGWKGKWPVSKIEDIVTNGKSGTKMKAFKEKLSPEEIKAVSKYASSLGS